jgi:hypothetical protein
VFVLLQALVVRGIEQQALGAVERGQNRLARGGRVAADDGGHLVALEQLASFFRKHGVVAGAVLHDQLDLATEDTACGVDFFHGHLLGIHEGCLSDGNVA